MTKSEILEPRGIPSSATLIQLESSNIVDVREYKTRRYKVRARIHGAETGEVRDDLLEDNQLTVSVDPEAHLSKLLPTFTPLNLEGAFSRKSTDD